MLHNPTRGSSLEPKPRRRSTMFDDPFDNIPPTEVKIRKSKENGYQRVPRGHPPPPPQGLSGPPYIGVNCAPTNHLSFPLGFWPGTRGGVRDLGACGHKMDLRHIDPEKF